MTITEEVLQVTVETVRVLRQHLRLRNGLGACVAVAVDDLSLAVSSRLGLQVPREAIRNLLDALVAADILVRYPGPRYVATTYRFTTSGLDLDATVAGFVARYHPRWSAFPRDLRVLTTRLALYEATFRKTRGGLPRRPTVLEAAERLRLNGAASLDGVIARLERLPDRPEASRPRGRLPALQHE